jgi:hypothetical protein
MRVNRSGVKTPCEKGREKRKHCEKNSRKKELQRFFGKLQSLRFLTPRKWNNTEKRTSQQASFAGQGESLSQNCARLMARNIMRHYEATTSILRAGRNSLAESVAKLINRPAILPS